MHCLSFVQLSGDDQWWCYNPETQGYHNCIIWYESRDAGNQTKIRRTCSGSRKTFNSDKEIVSIVEWTYRLLAWIDLHNGVVTEATSRTPNSDDFISFLNKLDLAYFGEKRMSMILNNLSFHTAEKTWKFILTMLNRFEFPFIPKRLSWLNIVQIVFSKLSRTMLCRISSKTIGKIEKRAH